MAEIIIEKLDKKKCAECFKENVIQNQTRIKSLEEFCLNGEVDEKMVRPIAWKIFLDVLPRNESIGTWVEEIQKMRTEYKRKKNSYFKIKKFSGDPLGSSLTGIKKKNNPEWEVHHQEVEMKNLINLDLSRTYQDIDLFLNTNNKNLLANILFIWGKENSDVSYQQGMNELLAVFYLGFYPYYFKSVTKPKPHKNDIYHYVNSNDTTINEHLEDIYVFFNDEEELEADLYYIFCNLMKRGIKELFDQKTKLEKSNPLYKEYELFPDLWKDESDEDVPTHINRRCSLLVKEKMKILDEELFSHFKMIDLVCTSFLQRWFRCMFGREFEYKEVLILWDAIFANENPKNKYPLIFMDYIALAMFFRLRKDLIQSEQNECFSTLFRYPKVERIVDLVSLSDKVKDAINDQLKGIKTLVYEVLFIPRPLTVSPHTYNQIPNKFSEEEEKKTNQTQQEEESEKSSFFNNALSSLGNIGGMIKESVKTVSSKVSEKIDQIKSDNNPGLMGVISNLVGNNNKEEETNQTNDSNNYYENTNYSNNNQNYQQDNYIQANEESLDNSGGMEPRYIVNKLEKYCTKYGRYMEKTDRDDFRAIVDYLTNNINNNS